MKYLFFDCEFASSFNGRDNICEFGFVVTDENFNIVDTDNLIINPNITRKQWDKRVVREILTRPIEEYEKSVHFSDYYVDIKKLILSADYVFGHSLSNDAKVINSECKRNRLDSIDYDFYDVQHIYMDIYKESQEVSLVNALKELSIEGDPNNHDARSDAYNTMLELKAILNKEGCNLDSLLELSPNAKDRNENYLVASREENKERRYEKIRKALKGEDSNIIDKKNYNGRILHAFIENYKPSTLVESEIKGMTFTIASEYRENHYKETINIFKSVLDRGAKISFLLSECNFFVLPLEADKKNEEKLMSRIDDLKKEGNKIEVVSFKDFLSKIDLTEEQLEELPFPSLECLYSKKANIEDRDIRDVIKEEKSDTIETKEQKPLTATFGDFFKDFFDD